MSRGSAANPPESMADALRAAGELFEKLLSSSFHFVITGKRALGGGN